MKTAILIHGCHLETIGWEDIVWGNPAEGRMGRVPKALELLANEQASLLLWGTGASKKDGLVESSYTFRYAVARANELPEFADKTAQDIESALKEVSFLDTETQNTTQEVERAAGVCHEHGVSRLILVSSPTHISRCLLEAEKLRALGNIKNLEVFATASDVPFKDSTAADVVVVEPPHRGDQPLWQTYKYVGALFAIIRQGENVYQEFLAKFGKLLEEYGIQVTWGPRK